MSDLAPSDAVRQTMLALGRGDEAAFLDGLSEDVEWRGGGVLLPVGVWRGREEVRDGLHASSTQLGRLTRIVLREVSAERSAVLLLGVIGREGRHGSTATPNGWVCEVRGDHLRRVTAYVSDAAARAAWMGQA